MKGAVGRLSFLRQEKRENQDGESVKEDEKAGEGLKKGWGEEKSEIKNERDNPRGCLPWSCWQGTKEATNMHCPL